MQVAVNKFEGFVYKTFQIVMSTVNEIVNRNNRRRILAIIITRWQY